MTALPKPARASLVAGLTLLVACGGGSRSSAAGAFVPVEGGLRDLRALAGDWEGQFVSARGSRRGTNVFSLLGGRDSAYGRVVLRGPTAPPGCTDPVSRATGSRVEGDIVLTIARVNVGGRSVGGWLRPYPDPELGCLTDTWFEGTIMGDTLDGMYFSHPADTAQAVRLGTWWVARRP
ncbi:hypothetical protein BH24GEM1_BH24GEM1_12580 [soil metagenome]